MGKFISIAYVGGTFGTALTYPLGGFILKHYSWDVLFYVTGVMAIVWFVLWTIFVSNDPSENKFIGRYEKTQILSKRLRFTTAASLVPPMHKILAVPTIWICALSEFGYSIALYFVIIEGPTFIKEVLGKNIQQVCCQLPDARYNLFESHIIRRMVFSTPCRAYLPLPTPKSLVLPLT